MKKFVDGSEVHMRADKDDYNVFTMQLAFTERRSQGQPFGRIGICNQESGSEYYVLDTLVEILSKLVKYVYMWYLKPSDTVNTCIFM